MNLAQCLCLGAWMCLSPHAVGQDARPERDAVFVVTEFGAVADGVTDAEPGIQAAIDAAIEAGGGTVYIPAAEKPYAIHDAITIHGDGIAIEGEGATIRFADYAMGGAIVDCIEVVGTREDAVENVFIRGLTIDANYWKQPGSYNPRGFDSDFARRVRLQNVTIRNAFVGMTFGYGVHESEAVGCIVTNWYNDAFNASGDGETGACTGITFRKCVARGSFDEAHGGMPGNRNNAWEIEDGAYGVTLIECVVENCGGNGFAVRNHGGREPLVTSRVEMIRCVASNVSRLGFYVNGQPFPNVVEDVRLEACVSNAASAFQKDIRGLRIERSAFNGATTIGPARSAEITGSAFGRLRIWSQVVGESGPGHYISSYRFERCVFQEPLHILGNDRFVTLIDCTAPRINTP